MGPPGKWGERDDLQLQRPWAVKGGCACGDDTKLHGHVSPKVACTWRTTIPEKSYDVRRAVRGQL